MVRYSDRYVKLAEYVINVRKRIILNVIPTVQYSMMMIKEALDTAFKVWLEHRPYNHLDYRMDSIKQFGKLCMWLESNRHDEDFSIEDIKRKIEDG